MRNLFVDQIPRYLDPNDPRWQDPEFRRAFQHASLRLINAYQELDRLFGADGRASKYAARLDTQHEHRRRYKAEIAMAYELAPKGQKTEAIKAVMAQQGKKTNQEQVDTTLRRVQRIQESGLTFEEVMAAEPELAMSYMKTFFTNYLANILEVNDNSPECVANVAECRRMLRMIFPDI